MSEPVLPAKRLVPAETLQWRLISQGPFTFTQALPVEGGWIYRTMYHGAVGCCFVPDVGSPGPGKVVQQNPDFP